MSQHVHVRGPGELVGIQFLIFITVNKYWLLDKDSRQSTSRGAEHFPLASRDLARLPAGWKQRVCPAPNLAVWLSIAWVVSPRAFQETSVSRGEHTDLVNLTFFFFSFFLS